MNKILQEFHIFQRFDTLKSMLFICLINYSNVGFMQENVNKKLNVMNKIKFESRDWLLPNFDIEDRGILLSNFLFVMINS
jgi:hypothetical protein